MDKKVIIFDFDNTIVNSLDYWYRVMEKDVFKTYGVKPDPRMQESRKLTSNKEKAEMFIKLTNLDVKPKEILDYWDANIHFYYIHKIKTIKGVNKFIYNLNKNAYTLVLASATHENLLRAVLPHFDLNMFNHIFTVHNTGYKKSDPNFFKHILKTLKVAEKEVLLIEDSVSSIKTATSLGIETISVIHKYNKDYIEELKPISKAVIKDYTDKQIKQLYV